MVELIPAPWTSRQTVQSVRSLMEDVAQVPVEMTREIEGFLVNRLQGVLLMEAWRLVEEGYATIEDIDRTVKHGLGLRWSFMGPFETIDLNAPGGVADYAKRLAPLYHRIAASRTEHHVWSPELISEVERQRRKILPADDLTRRMAWRDERLTALVAHKREQEKPAQELIDPDPIRPGFRPNEIGLALATHSDNVTVLQFLNGRDKREWRRIGARQNRKS